MRNARTCGAVALLSFSLFLGCSDAQDNGADNGGEAVTGGQTDVAHGSVGYLVVKGKDGKKLGDCSATLVGPNLVITAASCVQQAAGCDPSIRAQLATCCEKKAAGVDQLACKAATGVLCSRAAASAEDACLASLTPSATISVFFGQNPNAPKAGEAWIEASMDGFLGQLAKRSANQLDPEVATFVLKQAAPIRPAAIDFDATTSPAKWTNVRLTGFSAAGFASYFSGNAGSRNSVDAKPTSSDDWHVNLTLPIGTGLHQADVGGPVFATVGGSEKVVGIVLEKRGLIPLAGESTTVRRLGTLPDADQDVLRAGEMVEFGVDAGTD
jgi:hypothetical protein